MIKSFSFTINQLSGSHRFEPSYYYYTSVLKQKLASNGIKFDKLITLVDKISDGEHSQIKRQKTPGVRYLYGRNIKEGTIDVNSVSDIPYISDEDYTQFTRAQLQEDDVLITIVGTVGKSALYKNEYVGTASIPRHIARIHLPAGNKITPEFLSALLRSKFLKNQIKALSTGNLQPLLSIGNIGKIDIPIFEDKIIMKITELEADAIAKEAKALRKIEQAKTLFREKLVDAFIGVSRQESFTVNFSRLRASTLWGPRYFDPYYWEILKRIKQKFPTHALGLLAEIASGDEIGSINYKSYVETVGSEVPFIRTTDLANYEVSAFPDNYVDNSFYKDIEQDIQEGDLIFTKDGKIGVTAFITKNDKLIFSSGLAKLRISDFAKREAISAEYLFTVLSTAETGLLPARGRTVIASTIPHLREDRLKSIEIPVLAQEDMNEIKVLAGAGFKLKDEKKLLFRQVQETINNYLKN